MYQIVEVSYKKPDLSRMRSLRRLKEIPTRKLMRIHDAARAFGGMYEEAYGLELNVNDIKAELNTREHIPNKQEARVIRQTRAKNFKTDGKGRRRR